MELLLAILGWVGFAGLGLFYWKIGSGKVLSAYIYGTVGAFAWLLIGAATMYGYMISLPSLVLMELMVIILNFRGIYKWRKDRLQEKLEN